MKNVPFFIWLIVTFFGALPVTAQQNVLDSLKATLQTADPDTNKVNTLNTLSESLWRVGDNNQSFTYANDAMMLAQNLNYKKGLGDAYNNLGIVASNRSDYTESRNYHTRALDIFKSINNKKYTGRAYINIGTTYNEQGDNSEALNYYLKGLKLFEEIGSKKGMALANFDIGNIYLFQKNPSEALNYYSRQLQNLVDLGDESVIAPCFHNIGNAYLDLGNDSAALRYYEDGRKIAEKTGDMRTLPIIYSSIANILEKRGRYGEAIDNLRKSIQIFAETGDQAGMANAYLVMGNSYIHKGDYYNARDSLNKGLSISKSIAARERMKDFYASLSNTYYYLHLIDSMHHYSDLYVTMKDSLLTAESSRQLSEMQVKYETEKKDREITQLNLENEKKRAQLRFRNWTLSGGLVVAVLIFLIFYQGSRRRETKHSLEINQLNNKVLRTQLNPHFIFNALNSIRNYIQQHPGLADSYLTKFSTLMRQVLENSAEDKITLQDELTMLENYMQLESLRLPYGFDYEVKFGESVDTFNTMVPPLILQPMIENAIWHGLKPLDHRGKITLHFAEKNGLLEATIEDNGIGIASTDIETKTVEKKRSMGMQITRERIDLINRKAKAKGWLVQELFPAGSQARIAIPV